jgi:hypothetical protein
MEHLFGGNVSGSNFSWLNRTSSLRNSTYLTPQRSLTAKQYQELYIWAGVTFLLLYISAFSNMLTLVAIVRAHWWRTGIQVLIASLTVCDFVATFFVYPQLMINILIGKNFPFDNNIFCRISGYVTMCTAYITPLHCCMIAINRLFAIVVPKYAGKVTSRGGGCVMAAVSCLLPAVIFVVPLANLDGYFTNVRPFNYCSWAGYAGSRAFSFSASTINMYAPTVILTFCYSAIYLRLKSLDRLTHNQVQIQVIGQKPATVDRASAREVRRLVRHWQVAKMMLVTFIVFAVCYIPLTTFYYVVRDFYRAPMPTLLAWLFTVSFMAPFCNPVPPPFHQNQTYRVFPEHSLSLLIRL